MKISIPCMAVLCSGLLLCSAAHSTDVEVKGQLVFEPCTLSQASENISLPFGTIVKNYFYTADRTPPEPFSIELEGCDTTIDCWCRITAHYRDWQWVLKPRKGSYCR